jgi:[amino-group carrier protein]-gamma-(L-lysyl/L-ornithyl)-L-glutamate aminotransferase
MSRGEPHLVTAFPQKDLSIERAQGAHLYAQDGRRYVDLGGASHGVANFGHNHPRIAAAVQEQLGLVTHVSTTIPTPSRRLFLDRLHDLLPSHLGRTFLSNSGTEAVEAALKFSHAATKRSRFVAVRNAFHGRTLGALSTTFRPAYRQPFERLLRPVDFVPLNDAAALESAVTDETAAILVEPIQGEGGLGVASPEFLAAAERVAHRHGALLVVDEVQTGLGRTGRDLAIEAAGIRPDILLLGKSLAGGLPIGATAMTEEVAAALPPAGHGNTFGGSPLVCAAAAAALQVLRDERLAERARVEGEHFSRALRALASPLVREVRGAGLMLGLDLRLKPAPVLNGLLDRGFLALPSGLTVARFLPPLTIDRADLDAAAQALRDVLHETSLAPEARAA